MAACARRLKPAVHATHAAQLRLFAAVSSIGLIWLHQQQQPDASIALRLFIAAVALAEAGAAALAADDVARGGGAVSPATLLWEALVHPATLLWEALVHSQSALLFWMLRVLVTHETQGYTNTLRSSAGMPAKLLTVAEAVCGAARRSLECAWSVEAIGGDREHADAELSGALRNCAALQQ